MTHYADLHDLSEDRRIEAIGKTAMTGLTVGVCLEKNEPRKIERYIAKVTARYPEVAVLQRIEGPTPGVITIKFGKPPHYCPKCASELKPLVGSGSLIEAWKCPRCAYSRSTRERMP